MKIPTEAQKLIEVLEDATFEAWVVGGYVRDAVIDVVKSPILQDKGDIDIACSAPFEDTERACTEAGFTVHRTGVEHGTVTVVVDGKSFEVTTFRIDGSYSDGRHPDSVTFVDSIELDLARRDFTMNAIAWHPQRGLLDPYGGIADIRAGLIRCVGKPEKRLAEDALRILRGVRFASQLGFSIENSTRRHMEHLKWRLALLPVERVRKELDLMLLGSHIQDALMKYSSIIFAALPELAACKDFDQHTHYHCFDVLDHTAWVVYYTPPTLTGRWAALCHDIGKPAAFTMRNGEGHFRGHAVMSASIARSLMERLKMPHDLREDVCTLVRLHDIHEDISESNVKRMLRRCDGNVALYRTLLDLQRADGLAHAPGHCERADEALRRKAVLDRIIKEGQAFRLCDLAVNGDDILKLGEAPSPRVGIVLDALLDEVIDGVLTNEREALLTEARALLAH